MKRNRNWAYLALLPIHAILLVFWVNELGSAQLQTAALRTSIGLLAVGACVQAIETLLVRDFASSWDPEGLRWADSGMLLYIFPASSSSDPQAMELRRAFRAIQATNFIALAGLGAAAFLGS